MNHGPLIFLGVFFTFASSWLALVFTPYVQLQHLTAAKSGETASSYPRPIAGLALVGQRVYSRDGCMYCHTQQVRPEGFGADFERGWGPRRTVARDYIYDRPVMLGTMRTGPDLANIGVRQPSVEWHHLHLYNPRITSPGSIMPSYAFLYRKQKIVGQPSDDALELPEEYAIEPGYEIVPTEEARALVAYLLRQDRTYPLPEAEQ
ncbi:Cytochrome C oxidase, mono-heme subunit/FixO [Planctomycetes bacterium Pan216]|uniref:Cytochrome C oxidase, mono-heme subunit/FixO n=1 Tax=Kolteria novifilia TaxID=2527975 RepID=A0A518B1M6_9BACT|nr:Cytochrome C oxidase, mono-heme subunit/FixO [Planctomycetes bacterium Pan216]